MPKRSRTPQEKKELSYARDGRNTYGESRRQSEKVIARRKTKANRALRRAETQTLAAAGEADADVSVPRVGRKSWKKIPDAPLADYVAARLESRAAGGMNANDKQSRTLDAGRKRARVRVTTFMGGFFRGQNRAACPRAAADDPRDERHR